LRDYAVVWESRGVFIRLDRSRVFLAISNPQFVAYNKQ